MLRRASFLICAALPALLWAGGAHAQAREGVTIFEPAAFAHAAPENALDMVRLLPGFAIIDADADVRGYSGAQGNVLIDGAWPASKREDIDDVLARIPAAAVERIELIRGAAGIDMGGHAVLANIVRRRGATTEGAFTLGAAFATDGEIGPQGALEYGRRDGAHALELALTAARETDEDSGRGDQRVVDAGGATEWSATDALRTIDNAAFNASYRRPLAGGRLALTGALRGDNESSREIIAGAEDEIVREREEYREAEFGVRFTRAIGAASTLETLASQQLGWLEASETSQKGSDAESFAEDTQTGETIARLEFTTARSDHLSLNASLEGAFNFLESETALQENGAPVALPGSDVRIEERRAEAAFGARWRLARGLSLQSDLRVETSRITQTGDTPLERDLTYWKPRAALSWEADDHNQFRASASREVGQLDFSDFVAAASFVTGSVTAGNSELAPEESWRFALSWERRFWSDGALTLTYTHDAIDNTADRVLVESGGEFFDAPGNIGAGDRDMLEAELAAGLAPLGLANFRIVLSGLWRASSVTDPTTGQTRGISDEPTREGEISLTYSAARVSWGISYELAQRERQWRFDRIAEEQEAASWSAFIERRFNGAWRLRLAVNDLAGREIVDTRQRYEGPRDAFPLSETERRAHTAPGSVLISLRRNMGG